MVVPTELPLLSGVAEDGSRLDRVFGGLVRALEGMDSGGDWGICRVSKDIRSFRWSTGSWDGE